MSSFSPQSVSSLALHLCNSTFFWQHSSRPSQQFAPPLPHVSPPLLFGQVNTHLTVVNSISLHLSLNWFEMIESQRLGTPPLPLSALKHRHKKGRVWFKANSFYHNLSLLMRIFWDKVLCFMIRHTTPSLLDPRSYLYPLPLQLGGWNIWLLRTEEAAWNLDTGHWTGKIC